MFMRRLRKDKRGLTLIELVCALAILAIITATVGGAMVVATNSYRQGTVDTALQQEAQFTANAIESLIIDATNTVDWDGSVLTISNMDYIYEIEYDSADQTLTYTQYANGDPTNIVASDELLAEHVTYFNPVNYSQFNTTRNLRLDMKLENEGKTFEFSYNITSRNDPNAGAPTELVASINVADFIVLEPRQQYLLPISVVGPADTGYSCYFESESDGSIDATVSVESGGAKLTIGATENGGDDGLLRMWVQTNAVDAGGDPWKKCVEVKIRRVTAVDFGSGFTLISGEALKSGAVYSLTGTPTGTNLDKVPGVLFDNDYVDPNTIKWSFSVSNGDSVSNWVDVLSADLRNNEIRFKLKQDITSGVSLKVIATALHPQGTEGPEQTNKTGYEYATVTNYKELKLSNPFGDADIRRGTENYLPANLVYSDFIKADWERNHSEPWDPMRGFNGSYGGQVWFRFKSLDSSDASDGYPNWIKMTDQGDDATKLKLNAADFNGMKYMENYELEIYFSFQYNDFNNVSRIYPEKSNPNVEYDTECVYSFEISALSVGFTVAQDTDGSAINLATQLTGNNDGIGTFDDPLTLKQGGFAYIHYGSVTGASNQRDVTDDIITGAKCYRYNESSGEWESVSGVNLQHMQKNDDHESGVIGFNTTNNLDKNHTYKFVFGDADGETYAKETGTNEGGRGVIYFELD